MLCDRCAESIVLYKVFKKKKREIGFLMNLELKAAIEARHFFDNEDCA